MFNNKEEEKLLSSDGVAGAIADVIKKEMEEVEKQKEEVVIKDIKKVPRKEIFRHNTIFKVFNRKTKTTSLINGIQADGLFGLKDSYRKQFLNGEVTSKLIDDYFVEFIEYRG